MSAVCSVAPCGVGPMDVYRFQSHYISEDHAHSFDFSGCECAEAKWAGLVMRVPGHGTTSHTHTHTHTLLGSSVEG